MSDPMSISPLAPADALPDGLWDLTAQGAAGEAAYWQKIAGLYDVDPGLINLENGFWGVMAEPVRQAYLETVSRVNRVNSAYVRGEWLADLERVRAQVAGFLGAEPEEIHFSRGATESLKLLIGNYNKLKPGDAVLAADLDYGAMLGAMRWLTQRRGTRLVMIDLPEPGTPQAVLAAYTAALDANPDVRMMLLTHQSHRTGLVVPAREIIAMARARGVDVILDAAHSWGQMDFTVADLGVDFAGFNLHKWIGAPLGVGILYIRKGRLDAIDVDMEDDEYPAADIRSRLHTGSVNWATILTVPAALALHQSVGPARKAQRLRHLRDYWVRQARQIAGVQVIPPDLPGSYAAITSFRLNGVTDRAGNQAIVRRLRDEYGILTVWRDGAAAGDCVRVTPALFTTEDQLDRFVEALRDIVRG
jgi:selenocysteine lyase/cysteine desulfurase